MRALVVLISLTLSSLITYGAKFNATGSFWGQNGSWSVTGTDADGIPDANDTCYLDGGDNVLIFFGSATCQRLEIDGTSSNSTLTIFSGHNLTIGGDLVITGSTGVGKLTSSDFGTVDIAGDIELNGSSASQAVINLTETAASVIELAGTITFGSAGTIEALSASGIKFDGTGAQSIPGSSQSAKFGFIEIDKSSGTATLSSELTSTELLGNFTLTNGTFTDGGNNITSGGGSGVFTMGASTTFNTTASAWPQFNSYTVNSSSTINMSSGSDQDIGRASKTISFGTVNISGGQKVDAFGTVNFDGTCTLSSTSTFDVNGATVGGSGTLTGSSTDSLEISSGSFPTTSTVSLDWVVTTGSTVPAHDYTNLLVRGTGTHTLQGTGSVSNFMYLKHGSFATGGNTFTIKSSASGTAGMRTDGSVSGNITVERYVSDMTASGNPGWWWILGSPVGSQTLSDLNDHVTTTGDAGKGWDFTSVFNSIQSWNTGQFYDTTALSTATAMDVGKGFLVYMGSNNPTYDIPITIDYVGAVSTGNQTFSGLIASSADEWSLLANPYPSAVTFDLTSMTNSQLKNPHYINNAGGYVPLTNGTTLGLGEGFWIQNDGGQASLTFTESDKLGSLENNNVFNKSSKKSGSSSTPKLLVKSVSMYGYADQSYLALDDTKTLGMDYPSDFDKLGHPYGFTNVSFDDNGELRAINNIPSTFNGTVSFPIRFSRVVTFNQNVNMTVTIEGVEDFRKNNICLSLEDLSTGAIIPLLQDYTINTTWADTSTSASFILHLNNGFDGNIMDASCYGFSDGEIEIKPGNSGTYDYYLKDLVGNLLDQELNKTGASHTFDKVGAGAYVVELNDNGTCGSVSSIVEVVEPDAVVSFFTVDETTVDLNINPEVEFNNFSANANAYLWNFDDGVTSTDDNPKHTFTMEKEHMVSLIASDGPCVDTTYKTIKVMKSTVGIEEKTTELITFSQLGNKIQLNYIGSGDEIVDIELFDALGKQLSNQQALVLGNGPIWIELPQSKGVYLLKLNGDEFNESKRFIVN